MTRPLIGVTTSARFTPAWPFLALAVWIAGGRAARITPRTQRIDLDALDGLVVGGGDDIGAEIYGGAPTLNTRVDQARDEMELSLLARFWRGALPILGICRGAQVMNVFQGGTLHADIHEVYVEAPKMRTILPKKCVRLSPKSDLRQLMGVDELAVNSLHHQAVDVLGDELKVAARDEMGIVQAVESRVSPFRVGVQWHPEFLLYRPAHRALFNRLVRVARGGSERIAA